MKEIPLGNGLNAKVNQVGCDEIAPIMWEYGNGAKFRTLRGYDPQRGKTYAAHDTPSRRRVFMHDVIMGLDTLEDE